MARKIEAVEIFASGTHHGSQKVEITESDLDQMVHSFEVLKDKEGFKPVLKLGHDEAQSFFGQVKGAPNLGFIDRIWRVGKKILADFSNVPDALVDLIDRRRYNAVSIEVIPKTEVDGVSFSNVLVAVALLGAELPAVKGLKELAATLFTEVPKGPKFSGDALEFIFSKEMEMPATYSKEQLDDLIAAAVSKAVDVAKNEFEATVSELSGKVAKAEKAVDTANATSITASDALRQYEDDVRKASAETMVDDAIKAGKLVPAQKDEALAFALNLRGTIKFGDTEKSASDVFKSFIEGLPAKVDFSERGAAGESNSTNDAMAEVHQRATKFVQENDKMTYADARTRVLAENPLLKQRYFEMED